MTMALAKPAEQKPEVVSGITILSKETMEYPDDTIAYGNGVNVPSITKFFGKDLKGHYCTGYLTTSQSGSFIAVHVRKFGFNDVKALEDYANR